MDIAPMHEIRNITITPEILKLIAKGKSNKEIGGTLDLAEVTVKLHVGHILAKLNASDRTQATTIALQRGIFHLD